MYQVPGYVVLASRYVTIQQRTLLSTLKSINSHLITIKRTKNSKNSAALVTRAIHHLAWRHFIQLNTRLVLLCTSLRAYAHYWSPYLSLLFAFFILLQCYLFYIFLYLTNLIFLLRCIFFFVSLGIVAVELVLITQCASVVTHFKQLTKQNRIFFGLLHLNNNKAEPMFARNLLKVNSL